MTIAFGVIASDGIVVAADSEESIPGLMKREQNKIAMTCTRHGNYEPIQGTIEKKITITFDETEPRGDGPPDTDIAIVGAGAAGYIDAITPALMQVFDDDRWMTDEERIRRKVESVVRKFYREHIIPFASYPPNERPEIEILLAYQRAGRRRILVSEKTAVQSYGFGEVAAIGAGAFFAKSLASGFRTRSRRHEQMDVRTATLMAAYTVFRVKEFIDGCGKYTTLAILPMAKGPSEEQVNALEGVFREHANLEARTLESIFRHPAAKAIDAESFAAKYDALRGKCDQILSTQIGQLELTAGPQVPTAPKRGRKRQRPSQE